MIQISNYDTDLFTPILDAILQQTGAPVYRGTLPRRGEGCQTAMKTDADQIALDVAYRVVADHIRCLVVAITDGAYPSNTGRGYVLRRILRRASYYGQKHFGMNEPFLCDLVVVTVGTLSDAFPEMLTAHDGKNVEHVQDVIRKEECTFIRLLAEIKTKGPRELEKRGVSPETFGHLASTRGWPVDMAMAQLVSEEYANANFDKARAIQLAMSGGKRRSAPPRLHKDE